MIMYNAGGAAIQLHSLPRLLSNPHHPSLSWYFSQGVSPFHDWRNISSQSGLFCIKTLIHLHNLRVSSSLLIAAREGQTPPVLHQEVIPSLLLLIVPSIRSSDSSFSPASPDTEGQAAGLCVCVCDHFPCVNPSRLQHGCALSSGRCQSVSVLTDES